MKNGQNRGRGRKLALTSLALLLTASLSGCGTPAVTPEIPTATLVPGTNPVLPEVNAPKYQARQENVTLFFRYGAQPYLAGETRTLYITADTSTEERLVSELLAGPGSHTTGLNGLFPEGTKVTGVSREGRTLFVTLSSDLMNAMADEPENWREDTYWQTEVPLRRRLAMQSLVGTLTENRDVDEVQVLVEEGTETARLKEDYYRTDEKTGALAASLRRDADLFLTPEVTLRHLLDRWKLEDWQGMYPFLSDGEVTAWADFVTGMNRMPRIRAYETHGASISPDGETATFPVDLETTGRDGTEESLKGRIMRLKRVNGLWKISWEQLTGWVVE